MAKSHPTGDPPGQQQVGLGKSYPCKPFLSCSAFTNSDLTAPLGSAAPNKLYQKHTGLQPPEHEHPHCEDYRQVNRQLSDSELSAKESDLGTYRNNT